MAIYILHFERTYQVFDSYMLLGVFTSQQEADAALKEYETMNGFASQTERLRVCAYKPGDLHWRDGFVTRSAGPAICDIPPWAADVPLKLGEDAESYARRLLDAHRGVGSYPTGWGSEYAELKKYATRILGASC